MGEATFDLPEAELMEFEQGDGGMSAGYKRAGANNVDSKGNLDTIQVSSGVGGVGLLRGEAADGHLFLGASLRFSSSISQKTMHYGTPSPVKGPTPAPSSSECVPILPLQLQSFTNFP